MKNIILIFILLFFACNPQNENFSGIEINYKGDYFAFFYNIDKNNQKKLYIAERGGNYIWEKKELEDIVGKLYNLNLQVYKTIGTNYRDEGEMNIKIIESDEIVLENKILYGEIEIEINYIYEDGVL